MKTKISTKLQLRKFYQSLESEQREILRKNFDKAGHGVISMNRLDQIMLGHTKFPDLHRIVINTETLEVEWLTGIILT